MNHILYQIAYFSINYSPNHPILITVIKIDSFNDSISYLKNILGDDEKARCNKFLTQKLKDKYIICHGLLRLLIAQVRECAPSSLIFKTSPYGKPYVENNGSLKFNLSHSANYIAYAFAYDLELGIDIEERNSFSNLSIAPLVFSPSECHELNALTPHHQPPAFLSLWTKKEAISKALGLGFAIDFKTLTVGIANTSNQICVKEKMLTMYDVSSEAYVATLAVGDFKNV